MEACVLLLKRQKPLLVSTTVLGVRVLMADHAEILLTVTSAAALLDNILESDVNKSARRPWEWKVEPFWIHKSAPRQSGPTGMRRIWPGYTSKQSMGILVPGHV